LAVLLLPYEDAEVGVPLSEVTSVSIEYPQMRPVSNFADDVEFYLGAVGDLPMLAVFV
jgi:hypothetical protein